MNQQTKPMLPATIAALGIVYGDIGTSPLYAFRACFAGTGRLVASEANVLGVLSLILWALILVVSRNYLVLVMRADIQGEGGILALMSLAIPSRNRSRQNFDGRSKDISTPSSSAESSVARTSFLTLLGLFGASLLYGDNGNHNRVALRRCGQSLAMESLVGDSGDWLVPNHRFSVLCLEHPEDP